MRVVNSTQTRLAWRNSSTARVWHATVGGVGHRAVLLYSFHQLSLPALVSIESLHLGCVTIAKEAQRSSLSDSMAIFDDLKET